MFLKLVISLLAGLGKPNGNQPLLGPVERLEFGYQLFFFCSHLQPILEGEPNLPTKRGERSGTNRWGSWALRLEPQLFSEVPGVQLVAAATTLQRVLHVLGG